MTKPAQFRVRFNTFHLDRSVGAYSGGNQQKVLIGRALSRGARVFIFDEPTVGVDVAARLEICGFMKEVVEAGAAVVIISSDLPEVMHMSHRLSVIRHGHVVDHIEGQEITERRILAGFFEAQEQENVWPDPGGCGAEIRHLHRMGEVVLHQSRDPAFSAAGGGAVLRVQK